MPPRLSLPVLAAAALLSACAQSPSRTQVASGPGATLPATTVTAAPTDPSDPYERTNRQVLDFNLQLDDAIFRPVAMGYREAVNPWVRTRLRRFLDNMNEPVTMANNLLSGRPVQAGESLMRFFINSTAGGAGFFDVATDEGLPRAPRDFGQTLHAWGVQDGPYLMWPVGGPSNVRDSAGFVVDSVINPIGWLLPFAANAGRGMVEGIDTREQNIEAFDELRSGSLDVYARLRSVWQQRRNAQLGRATPEGQGLDVLDDPGAAAPAPPPVAAPPLADRPSRPQARPQQVSARRPAAPQRQLRVSHAADWRSAAAARRRAVPGHLHAARW